MSQDFIKTKAPLTFCLNGDNQVDAFSLAKIIGDVAELSKTIALEHDPDSAFSIEVSPFRHGSFNIDFMIVSEVAQNAIAIYGSLAGLAYLTTKIIKNCFEIKKLSRGEKPKEVSNIDEKNIKIEFADGATLIAPKGSDVVLRSPSVDVLVSNISSTAKKQGGFSITAEKETSVYTTEDAEIMSQQFSHERTISEHSSTQEVEMPIKKADILRNSSWEFMHEGRVLTAAMRDEDFLSRIHNGTESITAGDCIKATMLTEATYDDNGLILSSKHTIQTVHGGIQKFEQLSFYDQ